jgi:serine/threonine protein kinase
MVTPSIARRSRTHQSVEQTMLERRVRDYQVVRELGRGGMGAVFLARDVTLHRLVAIKVLRHELAAAKEQRARFRREARVTAQLNSDGIVAVHSLGEHDDLVYIVMEYVRGEALGSRLSALGSLPAAEVRWILISLARTLAHAHSRGIVHRDLKPDNILLDHETGRPLITDFGVALSRSLDPLPSEAARAFGTPHFMSPEQAAGETDLDGRSDVYALGVLGYLMLTGELPFSGDNFAAIAAKHISEPAPPIRTSTVPQELTSHVARCLEKDPKRRWQKAADLADALAGMPHHLFGQKMVSKIGRVAALVSMAMGLSAGR